MCSFTIFESLSYLSAVLVVESAESQSKAFSAL